MRKAQLLLAGFLFITLPPIPHVSGNTVNQGNADVHVQTNTFIQGGGTTNTHIETNVNGNNQVFESSQPGSIDVHVKAEGNQQPTTTISGPVATSEPTISIQPPLPKPEETKQLVQSILDDVKHFITNLLHFF